MNTIIQSAQEKKYTDFSNAVQQELKSKLSQRPEIKTYMDDFDKIQAMKTAFNKINTDYKTGE